MYYIQTFRRWLLNRSLLYAREHDVCFAALSSCYMLTRVVYHTSRIAEASAHKVKRHSMAIGVMVGKGVTLSRTCVCQLVSLIPVMCRATWPSVCYVDIVATRHKSANVARCTVRIIFAGRPYDRNCLLHHLIVICRRIVKHAVLIF